MQTHASCAECVRLWNEYEDAVRDHIKTVGQYQIAVIQQNSSEIAKLEPILNEALKRRSETRIAVTQHQILHKA